MANTQNSCSLVAVFQDYATAEQAVRDLVAAGFSREQVQIQSNFMTGAAGRSTGGSSEHSGGSWWKRLFSGTSTEEEQGHYAEAVRRGDALVCLAAPEGKTDTAVEILEQHSPIDIDTRVNYFRQEGYSGFDPAAPAYSAEEAARERSQFAQFQNSIPVVEEELQVGKRAVNRGGVRVFSQVVDQPVEEDIRLREEHVRVERRPVDRPLNERDREALRDQSIELTETAEEPVISKRARVKEEVVIGKEATERTERIHENVRHTEVKVERLKGDEYSQDFRRDYETNYARSGGAYETYEPAYMYGYRIANDTRYQGKSWNDVESQIKTDYQRQYPDSKWDSMKNAIRYGWDRVTRK